MKDVLEDTHHEMRGVFQLVAVVAHVQAIDDNVERSAGFDEVGEPRHVLRISIYVNILFH